jgi:hypothetical protein
MAETLISPGVLAREQDESQITSRPVQAGAAIIGPTVLGPVMRPTLITSYSEYLATFGGEIEIGDDEYSYFTSISAFNYFQGGGNTLLVTRVVSGSFSSAVSTPILNNNESGNIPEGTNLLASVISSPDNGTAASFNDVGNSSAGSGTKLNITRVKGTSPLVGADMLVAVAGTGSVGSYPVGLTGSSGTGAEATVTVDATGTVTTAVVLETGTGYTAESFTIPSQSLGALLPGGDDTVIALETQDLNTLTTAVVSTGSGTGYSVGDTITVTSGDLGGTGTDLVVKLVDADITDQVAFELETLSQGAIMNSSGSESVKGALANGTSQNLRYEITNPDTGSGTFSLLIRRGDDNTKSKRVLETYTGLSLDPKSSGYIARVLGDQTTTLRDSGTTEPYLQITGNFSNSSRYVRVKSVIAKTPNYFDNDGIAKAKYVDSIPLAQAGAFEGATGTIDATTANEMYDNVGVNTQGLVGDDYTDAINLLGNKDDFRYNVISVPGLNSSEHTTEINQLNSVVSSRGDAIAVIDLLPYGKTIANAVAGAKDIDSSYAAAYWPWCQVTDPSTGQLVWVPASTLIPGVYASNDATAEAWFAPAGINRGGLGTVRQAERKLTQSNRDTLYVGKVNPLATFPGRGVVVFGQKTLQTQASALDRVNVRRLLIALKNFISQVADNLVFEQNTAATRNNFLGQVNPYLESVQQRQGLFAFKVVMDDSNNTPDVIDRNELIGQIYVQPTKTAEFIYLDFNILPTGATFPA